MPNLIQRSLDNSELYRISYDSALAYIDEYLTKYTESTDLERAGSVAGSPATLNINYPITLAKYIENTDIYLDYINVLKYNLKENFENLDEVTSNLYVGQHGIFNDVSSEDSLLILTDVDDDSMSNISVVDVSTSSITVNVINNSSVYTINFDTSNTLYSVKFDRSVNNKLSDDSIRVFKLWDETYISMLSKDIISMYKFLDVTKSPRYIIVPFHGSTSRWDTELSIYNTYDYARVQERDLIGNLKDGTGPNKSLSAYTILSIIIIWNGTSGVLDPDDPDEPPGDTPYIPPSTGDVVITSGFKDIKLRINPNTWFDIKFVFEEGMGLVDVRGLSESIKFAASKNARVLLPVPPLLLATAISIFQPHPL